MSTTTADRVDHTHTPAMREPTLTPLGRVLVNAWAAARRDIQEDRDKLAIAITVRCVYANYSTSETARALEIDRAELAAEERRFQNWMNAAAQAGIIVPSALLEDGSY
ncbi:MAG: hypothetical protein JNL50_13545 [Phycisphaerae bacterium]|nr:hypothetical protein [Phycisphaerae bacterium]